MSISRIIQEKMRWLGGAVSLSLLLAHPAQAFTIQELLTAAARQPGVAASELAAREGGLREQAATVAPKDSDPQLALANFYKRQKDFAKTEAAYQKAIALSPQAADIEGLLANFYVESGKFPEAAKLVEKVLAAMWQERSVS